MRERIDMIADGIARLEKHVHPGLGEVERVFADAVENGFEVVGEFCQVPVAERSRTALDGVYRAKNRVQRFFIRCLQVHSD